MSEEFPLFPELPETGKQEVEALLARFKTALAKVADEAISELYVELVPHIESDAWGNFRNQIVAGLRNYGNRHVQAAYDFKQIRQAILEEYRVDLIVDLNQDLVEENESLKKRIEEMQQYRDRRY